MIKVFLFLLIALVFSENDVIVKQLEGEVDFLKEKKTKWKNLKVNSKLKENDKLRTGLASRVDLLFNDASLVRFGENAEASIQQISQEKNLSQRNLKLEKGSLIFQIEKLSKGSTFNFPSPSATASVRGTKCDYGTNIKRAYLGCKEGLAKLISAITGDSVDVCAGCIAIQQVDGSFVVKYIENEEEFEKLLQKSKELFFGPKGTIFDADSFFISQTKNSENFLKIILEPDSSRSYLFKVLNEDWMDLSTDEFTIKNGIFWKFKNWKFKGDSVIIEDSKKVNTRVKVLGNMSNVQAYYEKESYLSFLKTKNGSVLNIKDTIQILKGKVRNIKVIPDRDYSFYRWKYDENSFKIKKMNDDEFKIQALKDSVFLELIFEKNIAQINIKTDYPNSVIPSGNRPILLGEKVDFEAIAPEGYYFKEWKFQGNLILSSQTDVKITVQMNDTNATLSPVFVPNPKLKITELVNGKSPVNQSLKISPQTKLDLRKVLQNSLSKLDLLEITMDVGDGSLENWIFTSGFENTELTLIFESELKRGEIKFFNDKGEFKTLILEYR